MSTNTRVMSATSDHVWEILSDGWLYPLFVVGAARMRRIEGAWPAVGSKLHHSAGTWPLLVNDNTEVLEVEPGSMLRLRARAWPAGEAEVIMRVQAHGAGCEVSIEEDAVSGPGSWTPKLLRQPPLAWRNVETLRRLAYVAENRP